MSKIKLKRKSGFDINDSRKGMKRDRAEGLCQMEIPGVGRIRTGESHSDFHLTGDLSRNSMRVLQKEKSEKESIKNETVE